MDHKSLVLKYFENELHRRGQPLYLFGINVLHLRRLRINVFICCFRHVNAVNYYYYVISIFGLYELTITTLILNTGMNPFDACLF